MLLTVAFGALPLPAATQQPSLAEIQNRIVAQEQIEMRTLHQYRPLVETYIQYLRLDKQLGEVPDGDKYFLGRAELAKGVELEPFNRDSGVKHKIFGTWGNFFSVEFLPRGFLQMIYLDMDGLDSKYYKLDYVKREFLGEVRCLVFDVNPKPKAGKGRFVGRIWVEDQDYHIVRFNGSYGGSSLTSNYFNFESWRIHAGKDLWLPAFIYSEGPSLYDGKARSLGFKSFKAQTRLWGYHLGQMRTGQELSKVTVEAPEIHEAASANDYSPLEAERSWDRAAEDNVIDLLERQGLMAPAGEVEKVLDTVVGNLEVTNDLDIEPEVRCRVLMTSTLESFTVGHTIVLSRGLVDVLPNEASLAAILAHELGHVVLRHHMDTQFAFLNRVRFDEKGTFRHFDFARTAEEEQAADKKAIELLRKSPYKDQSDAAQLFLEAVRNQSKEVPNLVSPHLGNRVETSWVIGSDKPDDQAEDAKPRPTPDAVAALPLGGHLKFNPWNDQLTFLKSKPVSSLAEDENKPFQITPFVFYLTRQGESAAGEAAGATAANMDLQAKP
jgi:hypothetical protein